MEGWRRRPPLNSTLTRKLIELFQNAHFLSSLLLCYVYILHMHLLLQCSRFHAENSAHRPSTSSSLNTGTPITFRHINSHTFYPLFITVGGGRGILFRSTHRRTHTSWDYFWHSGLSILPPWRARPFSTPTDRLNDERRTPNGDSSLQTK